jgi:CDP-diacylglycerol--serine O-phosphatidyltransferase
MLKALIKHIPNTLTALNLLCGSLAVPLAIMGFLQESAFLIFLGFFFDITDGMVARLLKVQSSLGKELDSLADVISFGLAPAAILFSIQGNPSGMESFNPDIPACQLVLQFLPFILPVFAGLRLAKFNIDERQTSRFIGLPVPANGMMVMAMPYILSCQSGSFLISWLDSGWFIPVYSIAVSLLMVSPLKLYSLKLKGFGWKNNKFTFLFLGIALLLIVFLRYTGVFLIIPAYILYAAIIDATGIAEKS